MAALCKLITTPVDCLPLFRESSSLAISAPMIAKGTHKVIAHDTPTLPISTVPPYQDVVHSVQSMHTTKTAWATIQARTKCRISAAVALGCSGKPFFSTVSKVSQRSCDAITLVTSATTENRSNANDPNRAASSRTTLSTSTGPFVKTGDATVHSQHWSNENRTLSAHKAR